MSELQDLRTRLLALHKRAREVGISCEMSRVLYDTTDPKYLYAAAGMLLDDIRGAKHDHADSIDDWLYRCERLRDDVRDVWAALQTLCERQDAFVALGGNLWPQP